MIEVGQMDLLAVLSSIDKPLYYTDGYGLVRFWNRPMADLTGVPAREALGKPFWDLVHYQDQSQKPVEALTVGASKAIRPARDLDVYLVRPDGSTKSVSVTRSAVLDDERAPIGMVEILQPRSAHAELGHLKELGTMTHNLKGNLTVIMGYAEMLSDASFGSAQEKKVFAEKIHQAGEAMLNQISNIAFSIRIDTGDVEYKLEDFGLADLLEELQKIYQPVAQQAQVQLSFAACQGLIVHGDRFRLRQVFHNLLSNAVKHAKRGSTVSVLATPKDQGLLMAVKNFGPTVSREEQGRLFTKFGRLSGSAGSGTGLGLYVAKHILQAHGSSVGFHSSPDNGTLVSFVLPLVVEEEVPAAELLDSASLRTGRVLLVGPSIAIAEPTHALQEDGHETARSESGLEGLARARKFRPQIVVLSARLPDITAEDVYYALQSDDELRGCKTIILDSRPPGEHVSIFSAFVPRPLQDDALRREVQRLLRSISP